MDKYVRCHLSKMERSFVAQLRLCFSQEVETGRFVRISLQDRLCELRSANVIEDEEHFVFRCNLYHDLRQNFIREITDGIKEVQNDAEMVRLWKNMLKNFQDSVGNLLYQHYKRRMDFLYSMVV